MAQYHPLKFWLDPASIAEIVAHIQTYLVNNPINSTTEIETIIHDYLIAHPELIGGVESVNGETGEVVLTADNISAGENVTIKDVLDSLQDQIDNIVASIPSDYQQLINDVSDLKSALGDTADAINGDPYDPYSWEAGTYNSISVGSTLEKSSSATYNNTRKRFTDVTSVMFGSTIKAKTGYYVKLLEVDSSNKITSATDYVSSVTLETGKRYGALLKAFGDADISSTAISSIIEVSFADSQIEKNRKNIAVNADKIENTEDVVGEATAYIQNEVQIYPNLFNKETAETGYYSTDGSTVSSNNYYHSANMFVSKGVTYKWFADNTNLGTVAKYIFKDNGDGTVTPIKVVESLAEDTLIEWTSTFTGFVRANMTKSRRETFMFCRSADYPNNYSAFTTLNQELNKYLRKVVEYSANYCKNSEIVTGEYIQSNGTIVSGTSFAHTGLVELEPGNYVTKNYSGTYGGNGKVVVFYDSEGTRTGYVAGTVCNDTNFYTFTISAKSYVKLNLTKADKDTFMIASGTTEDDYPPMFVPYDKRDVVEEGIRLNTAMREEVSSIAKKSVLEGKSISFIGDSICAGAGYAGGYGKIIADNNGMVYQNVGVSGATITAETGENHAWICRRIDQMNASADYAILEGGVNDASLEVTLGSLSNGYYTPVLDDTTFYGAFESCLKQMTIRFPGKKIGFIIPHKVGERFSTGGAYHTAVITCCTKWGVPVLDLSKEVPPFNMFPSTGESDLKTIRDTYTYNGDGWHPTEAGYKKYYVDKITAWLETL